MKILIVGAGASGLVAAINYKRNHPSDEVLIIERLEKPLKKLLATGNGKCNLGNTNIDFNRYSDPVFAKETIENFNVKEFFSSIAIETKALGELLYPVSESAVSVKDALLAEAAKLNIKINVEEALVDYKVEDKIKVITSKNEYLVNKLYLAGGLKSTPKLGSDGSIFEILKKHNYKFKELAPGLSPIVTKEKTRLIDGVRVKANVKLFKDGKQIHEEAGEVLFKEHGLSGIVIFNVASQIAKDKQKSYKISIDLLPDFTANYLENYRNSHTFSELMTAFINPKISSYLLGRFGNEKDVFASLKNLEFTFQESYGFDFSQVSVGGILKENINNDFMSKSEKNVYLIGELLNEDGPCGGYNLTWAFASAIKSTK